MNIYQSWYGGLWLDFGVVNELMWFTQSMLEVSHNQCHMLLRTTYCIIQVIDFLHEHRIVHFDFLEQNLGINVLSDVNQSYVTGLLDPRSQSMHYLTLVTQNNIH